MKVSKKSLEFLTAAIASLLVWMIWMCGFILPWIHIAMAILFTFSLAFLPWWMILTREEESHECPPERHSWIKVHSDGRGEATDYCYACGAQRADN